MTFASVTNAPCKCGFLRRAADDPSLPIEFEKQTGEYQFGHGVGELKGNLIIYHCPFCGGAAPKSKRALLFHVIPPGEERRLAELLDGITTVRGALRKLGKPDNDNPHGMGVMTPEKAGKAPTTQWLRTLSYANLSNVAEVLFIERTDGRASWQLHGKPKKRRRGGRKRTERDEG